MSLSAGMWGSEMMEQRSVLFATNRSLSKIDWNLRKDGGRGIYW